MSGLCEPTDTQFRQRPDTVEQTPPASSRGNGDTPGEPVDIFSMSFEEYKNRISPSPTLPELNVPCRTTNAAVDDTTLQTPPPSSKSRDGLASRDTELPSTGTLEKQSIPTTPPGQIMNTEDSPPPAPRRPARRRDAFGGRFGDEYMHSMEEFGKGNEIFDEHPVWNHGVHAGPRAARHSRHGEGDATLGCSPTFFGRDPRKQHSFRWLINDYSDWDLAHGMEGEDELMTPAGFEDASRQTAPDILPNASQSSLDSEGDATQGLSLTSYGEDRLKGYGGHPPEQHSPSWLPGDYFDGDLAHGIKREVDAMTPTALEEASRGEAQSLAANPLRRSATPFRRLSTLFRRAPTPFRRDPDEQQSPDYLRDDCSDGDLAHAVQGEEQAKTSTLEQMVVATEIEEASRQVARVLLSNTPKRSRHRGLSCGQDAQRTPSPTAKRQKITETIFIGNDWWKVELRRLSPSPKRPCPAKDERGSSGDYSAHSHLCDHVPEPDSPSIKVEPPSPEVQSYLNLPHGFHGAGHDLSDARYGRSIFDMEW